MLEQEWLRRVWDPTESRARDEAKLSVQSALGHPIDIFMATRDDLYAYTHALMYLTDLGERRIRLPVQRSEVLANAEAALARCLDEQDYDLCGELLLTWPYLGANWGVTANFAFRVLHELRMRLVFYPLH